MIGITWCFVSVDERVRDFRRRKRERREVERQHVDQTQIPLFDTKP
jgi:hypothetical protein